MSAARFQQRNDLLVRMGYESYKAYLVSPLWETIRTRIVERDKGVCQACGKAANQVHHVTYSRKVLRGEDDSQLVAVCGGCHLDCEFTGDKKLTSTTQIAQKLRKRSVNKKGTPKSRKRMRPKCKCCGQQHKKLGRDDICMPCYQTGRALKYRQQIKANNEAKQNTAASNSPRASF